MEEKNQGDCVSAMLCQENVCKEAAQETQGNHFDYYNLYVDTTFDYFQHLYAKMERKEDK